MKKYAYLIGLILLIKLIPTDKQQGLSLSYRQDYRVAN